MTSTPHADDDERRAIMRAKKAAREEAERIEIRKRFPASISDYMIPAPPANLGENPPVKILKPPPDEKEGNTIESIRKELKDLQTRRKILDENLATVERVRERGDIAAIMEYDIVSVDPGTNPAIVEKLRIRKMVDEQIKMMKEQSLADTIKEQPVRGATWKAVGSKTNSKRGRMPAARPGAKVDTGLSRKGRNENKNTMPAAKTKKKPSQQTRSNFPPGDVNPEDIVCPDTEDYVTHVYGKADYHPRRTTVHNPYFHLKSPLKKPTFRKKKAVEIVKANMVKSAKTQTSPIHSSRPQYYFKPSSSPVRPPLSTSPTPGHLIPMAIPLGPPVISDAPEPTPVLIHQSDAPYTTFTVNTPEPKKSIRVYNPTDASHTRRPNTAVISVRGTDGADLTVHKMENIDIDTPDVSEATRVKEIHSPVRDTIPGSTPIPRHDKDESEETDGSLHIELRGAAGGEAPVSYHGPTFPPEAPPQRQQLNASDIADEIDKHELEQETVRWVEQEILARILSELYPPGPHLIKDAGPVHEGETEEPRRERDSVLLNPESLQLFVDAGLPIDEGIVNGLVEEELTKILREMIRRPAHDQSTRPKTPVSHPPQTATSQTPVYQVPTPLPTPDPSPISSMSEKPHLHTPSLTPESSMAESLPPKDPTPVSSPEPKMPSPKVTSPPKTPEETTLVETPQATPPRTPTPKPSTPRTPCLSAGSRSPPPSPKHEYPDPWGGAQFPLPEELHAPSKGPSANTFAPPADAVDLVVRTVTPPPESPDRSLSEPDTTTTSSSERGESSISEGQLLISHGEVRAKTKRGQLPGIIEDIFGEEDVKRSMGFYSTLKDAKDIEDYEEHSDGEIRLSMRPSMISRVVGHGKSGRGHYVHAAPPGDDPAGVYSRRRHPLPQEVDDDLSVGEVKPETIASRRNKFRKWREERSPKYSSRSKNEVIRPELTASRDSPLSMDDLQRKERPLAYTDPDSARTSIASQMDESLGANVIVVSPAKQVVKESQLSQDKLKGEQQLLKPMETLASEDFQKALASTDHSGVIKDSLEDSANRKDFFDYNPENEGLSSQPPAMKVSLTLPTAEQAASMSSGPVSDDISEISGPGF